MDLGVTSRGRKQARWLQVAVIRVYDEAAYGGLHKEAVIGQIRAKSCYFLVYFHGNALREED